MTTAPPPKAQAGTWVLQADAAASTGYSVSAIRKWRRAGLVADRKRTTAGGLERVEVRLEDVQARMVDQPPERPRPGPVAAEAGPPAGSVIIPIADLEALFERVQGAERRFEQAEARVQAAEVEARFMSGQLAELRRQVHGAGSPTVTVAPFGAAVPPVAAEAANGSGAVPRVGTEPASADRQGSKPGTPLRPERAMTGPPGTGPTGTDPRRAFDELLLGRGAIDLLGLDADRPMPTTTPVTRPARVPAPVPAPAPVGAPRPAGGVAAPTPATTRPASERRQAVASAPARDLARPGLGGVPRPTTLPDRSRPSRQPDVASLASELRRLYSKLDGYRREPTISRLREQERERDLGEYDAVLLRACSALAVPTGLRAGEPVSIERRAALTKALARAGIDVRAGVTAAAANPERRRST